jgi:multidrug transporter EmrE-like cation transporter
MPQSIILAGVAVMISGISQILLKYGALSEKKSHHFPDYLKPYLNRYTLSAYCLLLVVTVISVYVLKEMPLKLFFPFFISMNIVVVVVLSNFILHESLTYRKIIAIGIIVFGILIFSI